MDRERDVENALVRGVAGIGGRAFKWVSPGNDGVPDRIVVLPGGQVIFVELKTNRGRLSAIQGAQIRRLRNLGCDVRVVYGMQGVEAFLNEIRAVRISAEGD